MPRLFVTPRDLNFISDITKELIKDVNGQVIYVYPISQLKTKTHGIYNESSKKVFDNPVKIDALVSSKFQEETTINQFGIDSKYELEAYVQYRDLVDKNIDISIGDFFSFSDIFYEITEKVIISNIFGQAEYRDGIRIVGTKAREDQFKAVLLGPTDISYTDEDAIQTTFVQQRGAEIDENGDETGDKRDLIENGVIEPLSGEKQVTTLGSSNAASFYGED